MWKPRIRESLSRSSLLIAYLFLVVGAVIAFMYMQGVTDRIEHEAFVRSYENCEAVNESKQVLAAVLNRLAQPREDDQPGDYEERQQLLASVQEIIEENDCPPPPNRFQGIR